MDVKVCMDIRSVMRKNLFFVFVMLLQDNIALTKKCTVEEPSSSTAMVLVPVWLCSESVFFQMLWKIGK